MKLETSNTKETFHSKLKNKIDNYAHEVYRVTKNFPKEEIYGVTSQLRRSAVSVALNYIEGYARNSNNIHRNFLLISYGSLKESKYLLEFSLKEEYLNQMEYNKIDIIAEEIGAMLWSTINKLSSKKI